MAARRGPRRTTMELPSVGTPMYMCSKNIIGRSVIEKLYVIGYNGDWIRLGYDNHPKAFRCNGQAENILASYAFTPEEAVEKAKKRIKRQIKNLDKDAERLQEKKKKLRKYMDNLSVDSCEMDERKYDPLDDLF